MSEAQASGAVAPISVSAPKTQAPAARPTDGGTKQEGAPDYKGTKHRVKIDGQEREVDYDTLIRDYQTAQAAQRRFQDAQKESARVKEIDKRLEQGDIKWLVEKLGAAKAKDVFENYLIDELEYDSLPPAEKKARELARENAQLKEERDKDKQSQSQREYSQVVEKAQKELENDVADALQGLGAKPTPRLVMRLLDQIEANLSTRGRGIPAAEAKKQAIAGIHEDIGEYLPLLSADDLRRIIPKSVIDTLMNQQVDRVMGEKQARRVREGGLKPSSNQKPQKPISQDDWFKRKDQQLLKKKRG